MSDRSAVGGNGGGGAGGKYGSGTRSTGGPSWGGDGNGGDGGWGGAGGSTGGAGTIYKADTATISGASASHTADSNEAIEYSITFDDGARLATNIVAKLGYATPTAPTTHRVGYTFEGWYTGDEGTGTKYYNANGTAASGMGVWVSPSDVTLYPKWVQNSDDFSSVTLWINGTEISAKDAKNKSGDGWSYKARSGKIYIDGSNKTYEIHGCDADGFAQIVVRANCTIKVPSGKSLQMSPGSQTNERYTPFTLSSDGGYYSKKDAILEVEQGATCSLTASSGRPAIFVSPPDALMGPDNTLVIKARGALEVTGGDGAADMGLPAGEATLGCGKIYVETYDKWFSNIRLGHGLDESNGLLNNKGKSARFYSYATGNQVYSVRMAFSGETGEKTIYRQRILGEEKEKLTLDAQGHVWLWLPTQYYEWAEKPDASYEGGDKLWNVTVGGHTAAEAFIPLNVKINGEDIAHNAGLGWYTKSDSSDKEKVTLVITNAGPHVVTGSGSAAIDVTTSMSLTISNLVLDVETWAAGKCAIWLDKDVTLDLTSKGVNSLTSSADAPGIAVYAGRTLNLGGDGTLTVQGGKYAAGIGGGNGGGIKTHGTINISSGHVTAIGGSNGAGIGSAATKDSSGDITISGGVVSARGGQYGAAIGGGYTGSANVKITGGTVFPLAGTKAAAIGDGFSCSVSRNNVFGLAAIHTTLDSVSPAAKNAGGKAVFPVSFDMGVGNCNVTNILIEEDVKVCKDLWTDESGKLTLWLEPTGGNQYTITMVGVDGDGESFTKSWGYKLDDSGNTEFSTDILIVDGFPVVGGKSVSDKSPTWEYDANTKLLKIVGGDHTITGGSDNGTINIVVTGSNSNITLENLTLKTPDSNQSPFVVSNNCTVTISGDNTIECISNPNAQYVSEKGSQYTAAIEVPEDASLTIDGDGTLTANGGIAGAGIGSRGKNENAGSITINSGYIYATGGGGEKSGRNSGGGAGVGGGVGGGVASIFVNGGYLHATGGKNAQGVGGGWGNGIELTNGTFRVTGGTVLAEGGDGATFDFVTAHGNTIDTKVGKSIVIDGGSVRPKHAFAQGANPYPNPVNSNDEQLVYAVIKGVGVDEGDIVNVVDDLWPQYKGVDLYADEDGAICLWGVSTNEMHTVKVQGFAIDGGSATFQISASSNTVQTVSGSGMSPDSYTIGGETCWRVEVHALPAKTRFNVTGLDAKYVHGTVMSDLTGKLNLYLPDGEYDFKVGSLSYHASVSGAPAIATYEVGIRVNDEDIGIGSGNGWTYSGTEEKLRLTSSALSYELAGTNIERKVSVYAATSGVKVRFDRLALTASAAGPFCLEDSSDSLEFLSGTLTSDDISRQVIVSGGSYNTELADAVAKVDETTYTNAYRVTVKGLVRNSLVEIDNLDGLGKYDTTGIYSDSLGAVHLYLPDGEYYFRVTSGGVEKEMVAIVNGGDETAMEFTPTGVIINGRDAARLAGPGWRNEDGLVRFCSPGDFVVSGTNDGSAVTLSVETYRAYLTITNLVLTNSMMRATPIVFSSDLKQNFRLQLEGTNIVCGVDEEQCGIGLAGRTQLTLSGSGRLEASSATSAGIGLEKGADAANVSLAVSSGEIVATGASGAAGIGGGSGENGFAVSIEGGMVYATGGENAAGIGGGHKGNAANYTQNGGTVIATSVAGGADIGAGVDGIADTATTTITGGSLNSSTSKITVSPKNGTGDQVYRITIPTGLPDFDVGAVMSDYDGYSLNGVKTDSEGKIYIWRPNGAYYLNIGGLPYRARVEGADTEAETWSVGVKVNGFDAATLTGEGWTYDVDTQVLNVFGDGCTVSGTNTESGVYMHFTNDVSVVVSNLVLSTDSSTLYVLDNASLSLSIAGTNSFTGADNYPGICIPEGSKISVTNIDTIVSLPDLDDIQTFTNTYYDIEYDEYGTPKKDSDGNVITNIVYDIYKITNYYDVAIHPYLTAVGGEGGAGIGSYPKVGYGKIEIFGGVIEATGGSGAAGIGAGTNSGGGNEDYSMSGTVLIAGGTVVATGGENGAGIGGGQLHSGGNITISGGNVTAKGGAGGAGIGAGASRRGQRITISGGEVTAVGGKDGAGIGGGKDGGTATSQTEPTTVYVTGGRVYATGGDGGAGIGSGLGDYISPVVQITNGTVFPHAGGMDSEYSWYSPAKSIGVGAISSPTPVLYPLTIKGASVNALGSALSIAPSNGVERVYRVTVNTAKTNELVKVEYLGGFDESSEIYGDDYGKIYLWLPNGTHVFSAGNQMMKVTVADADTTAAEWFIGVTVDGVDVARRSAKGKKWAYDYGEKTLLITDDCVVSGADTAGYVNILPATTNNLSFTISNLYLRAVSDATTAPIAVTNGTVTVRLAGSNTLNASETDSYAGLNVVPPATLVITNLEETASLTAYSGEDAAAIGGNQKEGTGTIRINGGFITAVAKDTGAGIGSGYKYEGGSGDIYISGGRIDAQGGSAASGVANYSGAGIGGGDSTYVGTGRRIVISGGTVIARGGSATSSKYAADIGAGYDSTGVYSIEITGGSVYPASSDSAKYFNKSDSSVAIPVDGNSRQVYKVMLNGFTPYAKVDLGMVGYGTNDIYADASGSVFLWLAPGLYRFLDGSAKSCCVRVKSDGTHDFIDVPESYGVEVNGVDVSMLSGECWSMDPTTSNLVITANCTLSGTNTSGQVLCTLKGTQLYVAVSNLWLEATDATRPPLTVDEGLFAYVTFGGTNNFVAAPNFAAIEVPTNSWISLEGEGWLMATGGVSAASIGASAGMAMKQERVWINSGNIAAEKISGARIHGGNIAASESITPTPVDWNGDTVYRVKFSGFTPGEPVSFEENIHGLFHDYKANGILADGNGDVYLWLPNGNYSIYANGQMYVAAVSGAPTNAAPSDVEVFVDGVNVGALIGNGWVYDPSAKLLTINWPQPYTLSGSNTTGAVRIETTKDSWLTFDGLNLSGYNSVSPITVAENTTMMVTLTNSSSIVNSSSSGAMYAIDIPATSSLKINGTGNIELASQGATAIGGGGTVEITGGSVEMKDGVGTTAVVDGTPNPAYCVAVTGLVANAIAEFTDLPDGYNKVLADDDGNVYLWLTNATYFFRADDVFKKAVVAGHNTTAENYLIGITVNGDDITQMSGTGWTFDGSRLVLTNEADYAVISGSNLEYGVTIELTECLSVVFSNLCFAAKGHPAIELKYHLTTGYLHDYHEIRGIGRNYIKSDNYGLSGSPTRILGGTFVVDATKNSALFFVQGGSFWIQGNDKNFHGKTSATKVYMVTVDDLAYNAKVAFDGLPDYYSTAEIYSDDDGKVYLWLPENWEAEHPITPKALLSASSRTLLGAASGTPHEFVANGYRYSVTISTEGSSDAEKGEPIPLESLNIDGFDVYDDYLVIRFTAKPQTWLNGFSDKLYVRASDTLPMPQDDAHKLNLAAAELVLEDGDAATLFVPLGESSDSKFFAVEFSQ
ncbi:MAG: InlB B-repeat-containing protein [Kiritimatiellae bacterium]|nr:InlB B-repeat-containing protein [Kiritimatiellia bacterium]